MAVDRGPAGRLRVFAPSGSTDITDIWVRILPSGARLTWYVCVVESALPELSIHLREAFKNDSVVIHINGVVRRRLDGLTTKLLLGYAVVFGEQVEEGLNRIDVELVSKGQSASIIVQCLRDVFLEVWFKDGQLTLHTPPEPPAYL